MPRGPESHRPRQRRALLVCLALTVVAMAIEVAGGLWTNSLMLLSDAAHMLSHAAALFVSYLALRLAARKADAHSHFGFYRAEILGAFVNGIGVLVLTGWILYEAWERFQAPVPIEGLEMTAIAIFGLVVNLVTAVILARAGAEDLNTKSAFVHMLGDTVSSVAIILGGVIVWQFGWMWVDPLLSVVVAVVVGVWGGRLLKESTRILLEFTPHGLDPEELTQAILAGVPEASDLHDLHVWEITSGYVCLTAHLVVEDGRISERSRIHDEVATILRERFGVGHVTLQLEPCVSG